MIKAVYAGSFDPVTKGHVDIIERAAKLVDSLTVLVMQNSSKNPLFSMEERVGLLKEVTSHIHGVEVACAGGLLADYARAHGVKVLVRGLRGLSDIEPEFTAAYFNQHFCPGLETIFLPANPTLQHISSTAVKQAARCGAEIADFVPPVVAQALRNKGK